VRRLPFSHPVKYLSIWTTRTSWTRCPPVILGRKSSNTFITEVESILFPDIFPDLYRLSIEWSILISGEYCHRYHLRIESEPLLIREKLPTPLNRVFFKIISERPVPKHLEKCQVRIIPYIIDITCTDTLLHISKTTPEWMRLSEEIRN
jgi:hypothetical protein